MEIALIAAVARNGVIGRNNELPWRLPEDLKYFKATTMGKPVIMGRKTWESIGRPLPGRANIVISRQQGWQPEGVQVAASVDDALSLAEVACKESDVSEAMVIGGEQIYRLALPQAQRLYLTEVMLDVDGDAYFPPVDKALWHETRCEKGRSAEGIDYTFKVLEKKPAL